MVHIDIERICRFADLYLSKRAASTTSTNNQTTNTQKSSSNIGEQNTAPNSEQQVGTHSQSTQTKEPVGESISNQQQTENLVETEDNARPQAPTVSGQSASPKNVASKAQTIPSSSFKEWTESDLEDRIDENVRPVEAIPVVGKKIVIGPLQPGIEQNVAAKIDELQHYRNRKSGGLLTDINQLLSFIHNGNVNDEKETVKTKEALQRVFEYAAWQWATRGFAKTEIENPKIIRYRLAVLYTTALGNNQLDPWDLDLVYSRFSENLGLPKTERVIDPNSLKPREIKHRTTFEMFQNWMNSKEVPWWHKLALIIGVPLAFAGLVTKIGGGPSALAAALGFTGLGLTGIGGFAAYTGAKALEEERIQKETELEKQRVEQARQFANWAMERQRKIDEKYLPISTGDEFSGILFQPFGSDIKNVSGLLLEAQAEEELDEYLSSGGKFKKGITGSIFGAMNTIYKESGVPDDFKKEADRIADDIRILSEELSSIDDNTKQQIGAGIRRRAINLLTNVFNPVDDRVPREVKYKLLRELIPYPRVKRALDYLKRKVDAGNAPLELRSYERRVIAQARNYLLKNITLDELFSPWSENEYIGFSKPISDWLFEETIHEVDAYISQGYAPKAGPLSTAPTGFLSSRKRAWKYPEVAKYALEKTVKNYPDGFVNLLFLKDMLTSNDDGQKRLAVDILNAGIEPRFVDEGFEQKYSMRGRYQELYPNMNERKVTYEVFPRLVEIAADNMDFVEDSTKWYRNLAELMLYDIKKNGSKSKSAKFIMDSLLGSVIDTKSREELGSSIKPLIETSPEKALALLGVFVPQLNIPSYFYVMPMEQLDEIKKLKNRILTHTEPLYRNN